jgi:hypothetical protein
MPQIALTTFLKLWSHGPTRKESEYRKYLAPGGYDYYWSMKEGAKILTNGGELEQALSVVDGLTRESERENNAYGIKTLAELLAQLKGKCFEAPRGSLSSPLGHLTIKVEPEFGIELEKTRRRLVILWNSKTPEMTTALSAVGLCLMFDAVALNDFRDCSASIYDLRQRHWFIAAATTATMRNAIRRELDWVDRLFEKFRDEKEGHQKKEDKPIRPSV